MIFLSDQDKHKGIPWVTMILVILNVLVFMAQILLGPKVMQGFELVPEEITTGKDIVDTEYRQVWVQTPGRGGNPPTFVNHAVPIDHRPGPVPIYLTLLTSMFMHGSLMHIVGNMWWLGIFGRNVERSLGHGRFLVFYIVCGVMAGAAHVASDIHSTIPCLGASGAVAGVMGAYLALFPTNRIRTWFFFTTFRMPAVLAIGLWFLFEYVATMDTKRTGGGGVAHWAHLGGFMGGFILVNLMVLFLRVRGDKGVIAPAEPPPPPPPEENEQFSGYLTMQIVKRMKEKERAERAAGARDRTGYGS